MLDRNQIKAFKVGSNMLYIFVTNLINQFTYCKCIRIFLANHKLYKIWTPFLRHHSVIYISASISANQFGNMQKVCRPASTKNDDIRGTLVNRKFIQFNIQNYFMFVFIVYKYIKETLAKSLLEVTWLQNRNRCDSMICDIVINWLACACIHTVEFTVKYEYHQYRCHRNVQS